MSGIVFKLEAFEGPLDLLLHLITKHKLDIYDIEINMLLAQYLDYLEQAEETDFDYTGEFLAMAARLIYIKTCSLLPQAEEAEELKKELTGDLVEYSLCKQAAARLRELCVYGDVFVRPPEKLPVNKIFSGSISPNRLTEAYMGISGKKERAKPVRAEQFSPIVSKRLVTVASKIIYVLKKLYKTGQCSVSELCTDETERSARIAIFLAVLELTKSGRIYLNEDNSLIRFNRNVRRKRTADHRTENENAVSLKRREETLADEDRSSEKDEAACADEAADEAKTQAVLKKTDKYANETRKLFNTLAVSAFAEFQESEEYEDELRESADAENEGDFPDRKPVKRNRFSYRYFWGSPKHIGCGGDFGKISCWSYWRERS